MKKEGGLPEGPVLEALLCAETGEKKIELKEEETIMDCQVGSPHPPARGHSCPLTPVSCPGPSCSCSEISPGSLGPLGILSLYSSTRHLFLEDLLTCPDTPSLQSAQSRPTHKAEQYPIFLTPISLLLVPRNSSCWSFHMILKWKTWRMTFPGGRTGPKERYHSKVSLHHSSAQCRSHLLSMYNVQTLPQFDLI